jgi:hypothetical protein
MCVYVPWGCGSASCNQLFHIPYGIVAVLLPEVSQEPQQRGTGVGYGGGGVGRFVTGCCAVHREASSGGSSTPGPQCHDACRAPCTLHEVS